MSLRDLFPRCAIVLAVSFAAVVVIGAASSLREAIFAAPAPVLRAPDSVFILTKDSDTAKRIVRAFQSVAEDSKYSLSTADPVTPPQAIKLTPPADLKPPISQGYYLVSNYGDAPLKTMVLLQKYAAAADTLGLSTVVGNDTNDDSTTGGGTTGGGTTFTSGATNSNTGKFGDTLKGGILGVVVIQRVQNVLKSVNPALYSAEYFNSEQVRQATTPKPSLHK